MSELIAVFRILPDGFQSAVDVKNRLLELGPNTLIEEPVAFGLSIFKFTKIIPDTQEAEKLKEQLKGLKGVLKVEEVTISRKLW